jgi:hypothetical protein
MKTGAMNKVLIVSFIALTGAHTAAFAQASCRAEVGARQADIYVRQCTEVSPATHPPCNAQNPCALIIAEIKRGCRMLSAAEPPAFCGKYYGASPHKSRIRARFMSAVSPQAAEMPTSLVPIGDIVRLTRRKKHASSRSSC